MPCPYSVISVVVFSKPWLLPALAMALLPLALATWRRRRGGGRIFSLRSLLRCLTLAVGILALSQPRLAVSSKSLRPYLVLQDVSHSTRGQSGRPIPWPQDLPRESFHFAATVAPAGAEVDRSATLPAAALRLAESRAADVAGIVIHTDGQFSGPWAAAAMELGRTGATVTIVAMDAPPPDARIAHVEATRGVDGNVRLRLWPVANVPQQRRVKLWRVGAEDKPILDQDELLSGPVTLRAADAPPADRATQYYARLHPGDAFAENDAASAPVLPAKTSVVLVARPADAGLAALWKASVPAITHVAPPKAPETAAGWFSYAAVIVVDATGAMLDARRRNALAQYVREGGGLLLLGAGPHSSPADRDDPLNQVSALMADPYRRRPMKVTVVLDASGSMAEPADAHTVPGGRRIKFDAAVQAVMSLRRHLTAADSLAVISFSDKAVRLYDSGSDQPDFAALRDALADVQPFGPTHLGPALEEATKTATGTKRAELVLVVSDLLTKPFDASEVAGRFRDARKSLAIVATTTANAPPREPVALEKLARLLRAPLKRRRSLMGLAEVFAAYLRDARGPAVRRGKFKPASDASPFDLSPASLAPVTAYIHAAAHQGAEALLRIGSDSILARRQVGLGRSICLAMPLEGTDNAAWRTSAPAKMLLRRALHWSLRPDLDPRYSAAVEPGPEVSRLVLQARDSGRPLNLLKLSLHLTPMGGSSRTERRTPVVQTAPGRYEGEFAQPAGPFALSVLKTSGEVVWRKAFGRRTLPEFSAIGANRRNLLRLAKHAGGRVVSARKLSGLTRQWARQRYSPLWLALLALAVALALLDWLNVRAQRRLH